MKSLTCFALTLTLSLGLMAKPESCLASDVVTPHKGCQQANPDRYKKSLKKAAKRWSLNIHLLMGLIQTESRFDAGATSRTGAAGLGQFTGIGCKEVQRLSKLGGYKKKYQGEAKLLAALQSFDKKKAYQPKVAIEAAALYLQHLLKAYKNDAEAALTHYNAGGKMARLVQKHGFKKAKAKGLLTFSQAKSYAPHVLSWAKKFKDGWRPKVK